MLSLLRYHATTVYLTEELLFYLMLSLLRYYATTVYLSQRITFLFNVIFTTLLSCYRHPLYNNTIVIYREQFIYDMDSNNIQIAETYQCNT